MERKRSFSEKGQYLSPLDSTSDGIGLSFFNYPKREHIRKNSLNCKIIDNNMNILS